MVYADCTRSVLSSGAAPAPGAREEIAAECTAFGTAVPRNSGAVRCGGGALVRFAAGLERGEAPRIVEGFLEEF